MSVRGEQTVLDDLGGRDALTVRRIALEPGCAITAAVLRLILPDNDGSLGANRVAVRRSGGGFKLHFGFEADGEGEEVGEVEARTAEKAWSVIDAQIGHVAV